MGTINQEEYVHSDTSRLAICPRFNIHLQTGLHHEKRRVMLDGRLGMHKPEPVSPQDLGQHFVHLEDGQITPNAQMASTTKLSRLSAHTPTSSGNKREWDQPDTYACPSPWLSAPHLPATAPADTYPHPLQTWPCPCEAPTHSTRPAYRLDTTGRRSLRPRAVRGG